MELTLQLEETLAEDLRQEASADRVSVEDLAHRLVRDALEQRLSEKRWCAQNRRRLELIARKTQAPLTDEEQEELRQLQSRASERAAPFDSLLLRTVATLRQEIERIPEELAP